MDSNTQTASSSGSAFIGTPRALRLACGSAGSTFVISEGNACVLPPSPNPNLNPNCAPHLARTLRGRRNLLARLGRVGFPHAVAALPPLPPAYPTVTAAAPARAANMGSARGLRSTRSANAPASYHTRVAREGQRRVSCRPTRGYICFNSQSLAQLRSKPVEFVCQG